MKKAFVLFALVLSVIACKNTEEKTEETTTTEVQASETFQGDFIMNGDVGVLMGKNFIYGVTINDMAKTLAEKAETIKKTEFDMIGVEVEGVVSKNESTTSEWENVITITKIVSVNPAPTEADIKIEEKKS